MNFPVTSLEGVSLIGCKNTLIFIKFYKDYVVKIASLFQDCCYYFSGTFTNYRRFFLEVTGDCIS